MPDNHSRPGKGQAAGSRPFFFISDRQIMALPEEEQLFLKYDAKDQDRLIRRMKAVKALVTGAPVIVIAPCFAAVKR